MSLGGFKARQYTFNANTSATSESMADCCKRIVAQICEMIMQCAPHWQYDSNFTPTSTDFIKIGSSTSKDGQCYAQFLINSQTGSQLLVFYNAGGTSQIMNYDCISRYRYASDYCQFGLGMSMIPGGSTNTWDTTANCSTSSFIPLDGTLIVSTSGSSSATFAYQNTYGAIYTVVAKEDIICVFSSNLGSGSIRGSFAVGKIFGKLFNQSDNEYYSQYGSFCFAKTSTNLSGYTELETSNSSESWLNTQSTTPCWNAWFPGSYFKSTITTRPITFDDSKNIHTNTCGVMPWTNTGSQNDVATSGITVFSQIAIGNTASDFDLYGVVSGNAIKGFLDTDFIRIVYQGYNYNQLLDGGNFIYLGGGIAIGWDASNVVVPRG